MKRNLLIYTIVALLVGLVIGYRFSGFFKSHSTEVKDLIIAVAILTIYPSMIQLRTENLMKSAISVKQVLIGLIFVFLAAPVIAFIFAQTIPDLEVGLGFVTSNVVPASSASLGYVLLAEGNIELATILAVFSLFGALAAVPAYVGLYAGIYSVPIPIEKVIESIGYTLVTPFILGQLTRYFLIRRRSRLHVRKAISAGYCDGTRGFTCLTQFLKKKAKPIEEDLATLGSCIERLLEKEVKPHLSLATMISMLVLVMLLIANKASLLIEKPNTALSVIVLQAIMLGILLLLVTFIDKILYVDYEDHSAIAFISATKNQSVAAAIAIMALSPKAAIVPALVPAIQAPVAIGYLQMLPKIRRIF